MPRRCTQTPRGVEPDVPSRACTAPGRPPHPISADTVLANRRRTSSRVNLPPTAPTPRAHPSRNRPRTTDLPATRCTAQAASLPARVLHCSASRLRPCAGVDLMRGTADRGSKLRSRSPSPR
ncbi:hypothetical protein C8Q78DRAFT_500816 [Trametes maxima]|nr:hypothetical protein C8Q78DRAFT_500816 [Trametes maxima]